MTAILNKTELKKDITDHVYTNIKREIKGNTVRDRMLNMEASLLNRIDDADLLGLGEYNPDPDHIYNPNVCCLKDGIIYQALVQTFGTFNSLHWKVIYDGNKEISVADITARDLYDVTALPLNIFVVDDSDGRWALYRATTTGVGATFVKISDPDLLNAVMTASQIKISYESNANTNCFTDALLAKLNAISGTNTGDETNGTILTKIGYTPENVANKDTDGTLAANSDTKYASQKATKTYVDTAVAGATIADASPTVKGKAKLYSDVTNNNTDGAPDQNSVKVALAATLASAASYSDGLVVGLWDDRGSFDASGGAYPSTGGSGASGAILKGDIWTISVAGTLPTGQVVEIGDIVRALINTPGNTQANWSITQNNIGYTAENSTNKSTNVNTDQASNTKYPSVKSVYDWAVGLFQTLANKLSVAEINTGTDDGKFATALGLEGSKYLTQNGAKISATAAGTDTYTATIAPAITAYLNTHRFFIKFTNANTGAATLNLNSLGAIAIKKNVSEALTSGDIKAGQIIPLAYDGTNFQIIGGGGANLVANGTAFWLDPVISNSVTAQPGSPVLNDRYLLPGAGLSGASWPGNENKVATWDGAAWVYTTPVAGNVIVVNSLTAPNNQFTYTGTYNTGAWTASSVVNAFTQGGNAFGGTANTGTTDNQDYAVRTNNIVRIIWDKAGTWFASTELSIGITKSAAAITAAAKSWISLAASTTTKAHLFFTAGVDVTSGFVNGMMWYNGSNLKFRDAAISKSVVFDNDSRGIAKSASFTVAATENGVTYNVTTSTSTIIATYPTGVAGFTFYVRKVDSGSGVIITSVASITMVRINQVAMFAYNGTTWDATILDEGTVANNTVMGNLSGAADYAYEITALDIHDATQRSYNYDQNGFTKDWLSGVFFRQYRAKTVTTTTLASLISTTAGDYAGAAATPLTVPANSIVSGKSLRLKIKGKYTSTNIADTLLIEIKIGSVTLTHATPFTVGTVYTDNYFDLEYEIHFLDTGASGSVLGLGVLKVITGAFVTTQFPMVASFTAQTLDTTIANAIVVNAQHSNASGSITSSMVTFERLA